MLSHSMNSPVSQTIQPSLQLLSTCYDISNNVIGGELSVHDYDQLYSSFMFLHQASRGTVPASLYGRNGDIQLDILDALEDVELFVALARDKKGSQFIQHKFPVECELTSFLYQCLLESDVIFALSKDVFGNFVVQKLLDEADAYSSYMFEYLKPKFYLMCKNRYSCRVAQKMITIYPTPKVNELLHEIRNHEVELIIDAHASHVIQKIIASQPATTFGFIVDAITSSEKAFIQILMNRYGCRVVQICLDRLVGMCRADSSKPLFVSTLLNKILLPIIKNAYEFSKDEFANYVIQFIITAEYLEAQRLEIMQNVILPNVLKLSQERFASHVLEKTLMVASPKYLSDVIEEILEAPKGNSRDKLCVMLFDQYGNYVVQRLLEILLEVKGGTRPGEPEWFERLVQRLLQHEQSLLKYSSGKKILCLISF